MKPNERCKALEQRSEIPFDFPYRDSLRYICYYTTFTMSSVLPVAMPQNLTELLNRLNTEAVNVTNEQSILKLRELLGSGIKIRHEYIKPEGDGSTTAELDAEAVEEDAELALATSRLNSLTMRRVILSLVKKYADYSRELTLQCNGVVLEMPGGNAIATNNNQPQWRILSTPSRAFTPTPQMRNINFNDYDIIDLKDGTTVTLYYYDSRWNMSSANGFNVADMKRIGTQTYLEAFISAAESYPDFNFDILDTATSYTIGFRNSNFHPLADLTTPKMWLVQSCKWDNSDGGETRAVISTTEDIGLPLQTPSQLIAADIPIHKQIYKYNSTALNNYLDNKVAHYGFVLKSRTGAPNYILKSTLLTKMESILYNIPKYRGGRNLNETNYMEYVALREYLCYNRSPMFLRLLPQYKSYYQRFDAIFKKLLNKVLFLLKSSGKEVIAMAASPADLRVSEIAAVVVKHIESTNPVSAADPQCSRIVQDFILNIKYAEWYFCKLISK